MLHKKLKNSENHRRNDAEQTLCLGSYANQDVFYMSKNYIYQQSNGKMGELGGLKGEMYGDIFMDQKQKNSFVFALNNFGIMNGIFSEMNKKCDEIIDLIDKELNGE